jgi:hypothetical protein
MPPLVQTLMKSRSVNNIDDVRSISLDQLQIPLATKIDWKKNISMWNILTLVVLSLIVVAAAVFITLRHGHPCGRRCHQRHNRPGPRQGRPTNFAMVPQYGANAIMSRQASPTATPAPGPFHIPRSTSALPPIPASEAHLLSLPPAPAPPIPIKKGPKKPPRSAKAMHSFVAIPPPIKVPSVSIYSPLS